MHSPLRPMLHANPRVGVVRGESVLRAVPMPFIGNQPSLIHHASTGWIVGTKQQHVTVKQGIITHQNV